MTLRHKPPLTSALLALKPGAIACRDGAPDRICWRMFWGRRNTASRKEPRFGFTGSLSDLRLTREDRVAAARRRARGADSREQAQGRRRRGGRAEAARKTQAQEEEVAFGPRFLRPHGLLGPRARPLGRDRDDRPDRLGRRASAADPVAGGAEAPADHPDRRRRRQHPCHPRRDGRHQYRAEESARASAEGVHRHRGPALLFAHGHRPDGHRSRRRRERHASRRRAGRLDAHAAARQKHLPDAGAHHDAQAAGGRARAVAGAQVLQERDSRALSQPRLFRLRRLRRRSRRAEIFRQVRTQRDAGGGRDAGRPRQVAVAACAEPQSGRRRAPRQHGAERNGRRTASSPKRRPRRRSAIPPMR